MTKSIDLPHEFKAHPDVEGSTIHAPDCAACAGTGDKDLRFTVEDAVAALEYAGEGRTNSIKPDLLANFINKKVERELAELRFEKQHLLAICAELRQQHAPDSHMDEYIIPAFTQMLRFVRLALAGEKTLYSQARFMAEKLLEYGFPKQSGYLMDVVEGKGEIIHAKETVEQRRRGNQS